MRCHEVEPLLVAWHDGELGASAALQVEEHLQGCARCVARSQALLAATPTPWAEPPPAIQARLAAALDVDLVLEEADRRGPSMPPRPLPRWLTEPREVHPIAALGYAALLVLSIGWGWANWARLPADVPGPDVADLDIAAPAATVIPADAYAPASYQPPEVSDEPGEDASTDR